MTRTAVLSTVYETFYERHPTGDDPPRVRLALSDADFARLAQEFGERFQYLFSGSTILSVLENGKTVSIARVDEFEGDSTRPSRVTHVLGPEIDPSNIPPIQDRRWHSFKGHPLEQIPQPHSPNCPNPGVFGRAHQ